MAHVLHHEHALHAPPILDPGGLRAYRWPSPPAQGHAAPRNNNATRRTLTPAPCPGCAQIRAEIMRLGGANAGRKLQQALDHYSSTQQAANAQLAHEIILNPDLQAWAQPARPPPRPDPSAPVVQDSFSHRTLAVIGAPCLL